MLDLETVNNLKEDVSLSESSREVSVHIAEYLARNASAVVVMNFYLAIQSPLEKPTFGIWKFFELTVPYVDLANYVCMAFAILDFSFGKILKSALLSQ